MENVYTGHWIVTAYRTVLMDPMKQTESCFCLIMIILDSLVIRGGMALTQVKFYFIFYVLTLLCSSCKFRCFIPWTLHWYTCIEKSLKENLYRGYSCPNLSIFIRILAQYLIIISPYWQVNAVMESLNVLAQDYVYLKSGNVIIQRIVRIWVTNSTVQVCRLFFLSIWWWTCILVKWLFDW